MEVDPCGDEADHCTYMLYDIGQADSTVSQSDVIIATVDFDELGTVCTPDSHTLSPSHLPCVSFDGTDQMHEDSTLGHTDSQSVVVQDVVEEEVNVSVRGDVLGDENYSVTSSNGGQIANSSTAINTYIEYVQNIVILSCYVCDRKFSRLQTLKGHVKRQHGTTCNLTQVTEEMLPVATICRQCGYVGATQQETCLHVTRKHRLPVARHPRQCKTNPQRLLLNRRRMAAQKAAYPPVTCLICKSEIGLLKNYDGHIKRYHQNDPKFAEALNDVRRIQFERTSSGGGVMLNCETCGSSFEENRLMAHIRWKHGDDINVKQLLANARLLIRSSKQQRAVKMRSVQVSCRDCGHHLRQISLANHIKFYCSGAASNATADSVVPVHNARCYVECTICGESMPRPKLLRHRRLVHHVGIYKQVETFMCEYCPREFTEAHQLRTHVKKHTGIVRVCVSLFTDILLHFIV